MSSAALSSPTPSRLVCHAGRWALEMVRLVPLDGKILAPRPQRLEGTEAILAHLRRTGEASAAQGAAQLMRALRTDEDRSFVAVDGEWVPSNGRDSLVASHSERELLRELGELRSEFLLLCASHQRLRRRVALLEAAVERSQASISETPVRHDPAPSVAAAPAVAARAVSPMALPARTDQPVDHVPPPRAAEPAPPVNPFRDVAAALGRDEPNAPTTEVALPGAVDVIMALAQLFGSDPGFPASSEPVPDTALELAALYAARYVDDEGNDVGVLLAETRSTAHLGGKLMGLPSTVIEEQARTAVLTELVLQAMSEVGNTLSSLLVPKILGVPIRCTPVEPFNAEKLQWVTNARQRLSFTRTRAGSFWLLAR